MEIKFEGDGWDAATQALVRAALSPLVASGARNIAVVRGAIPRQDVWEAFVEKHDGKLDCVTTWGSGHTLGDLLPAFLRDLEWLATPRAFRPICPPRYHGPIR